MIGSVPRLAARLRRARGASARQSLAAKRTAAVGAHRPGRTRMKIHCSNREGLLSACKLAAAAIKPRDVKPILRNLKAVADDGRCTLNATDLEIGVRIDVQGLTIEEPGEAILPAAKLIDILRESRD